VKGRKIKNYCRAFVKSFSKVFSNFFQKSLAGKSSRNSFLSGVFEAPAVEGSADNAFDALELKMFFNFTSIIVTTSLFAICYGLIFFQVCVKRARETGGISPNSEAH
jgi:hypothetical protein